MKYTASKPQSPQFKVLPAGEYPFRVLDAIEKRSKSGNDMIELKIAVGDSAAEEVTVFDYLVFDGKSEWKIDAFLTSCGMHPGEGVEADLNPNEFIGWEGRVRVKVEKYDGKDQNKVAAYTFEEEF
jgi:hypothetical protein